MILAPVNSASTGYLPMLTATEINTQLNHLVPYRFIKLESTPFCLEILKTLNELCDEY